MSHVDGDSCEGLDWLPCHRLILKRSGGNHRAWTIAEVGDGVRSCRFASFRHFVHEDGNGCVVHWFLCEMRKGSTVRGRASNLCCCFFLAEFFDTTQDRCSPCCEVHPTDGTEKRFALRLTLADCNCQCTVVLYHELVLRAAGRMDCVPIRCTTSWQCACSCGTCSGGPSGFTDSLSVKTIINKLWSWNAVIYSRVGGPAERALSSSLARCSGKSRTASWTLAVPWHL